MLHIHLHIVTFEGNLAVQAQGKQYYGNQVVLEQISVWQNLAVRNDSRIQ